MPRVGEVDRLCRRFSRCVTGVEGVWRGSISLIFSWWRSQVRALTNETIVLKAQREMLLAERDRVVRERDRAYSERQTAFEDGFSRGFALGTQKQPPVT